MEGGKYEKNCLTCGTYFRSNSRNTRFCGDLVKQCQKKYSKARKARRAEYRKNQAENIIWTQAHKLSRLVMENLIAKGVKTGQCERCECGTEPYDTKQEIHVNHIDGNHLNADPTNLENLCIKHHAEEDSRRKKAAAASAELQSKEAPSNA